MSKLIDRMVRAAKLDPTLYEEIVNDPTSQGHSIYVVVLFAIAAGFGTFSRGGATAVNICTITTLIAWYVWAFTVYYIGTRFFREPETRVDRKTVMRVMAFACAPGILRLLGLFPSITGIVFIVTSIWGLGILSFLGYNLDPLMLVVPFLISARAMSHGIQIVETGKGACS